MINLLDYLATPASNPCVGNSLRIFRIFVAYRRLYEYDSFALNELKVLIKLENKMGGAKYSAPASDDVARLVEAADPTTKPLVAEGGTQKSKKKENYSKLSDQLAKLDESTRRDVEAKIAARNAKRRVDPYQDMTCPDIAVARLKEFGLDLKDFELNLTHDRAVDGNKRADGDQPKLHVDGNFYQPIITVAVLREKAQGNRVYIGVARCVHSDPFARWKAWKLSIGRAAKKAVVANKNRKPLDSK